MREKTCAYFLSEINRLHLCGDCILLENIDSTGVVRHALIDSGFSSDAKSIIIFLEKHNVKKLDFFCITHSHSDHHGGAIAVLNKFLVDLIIMKEFDVHWSPGGAQGQYQNIIVKAIEKDIKILGISYISLISDEYSPTRGENLKKAAENAKQGNFIYFNENNTSFQFGSAKIKIMNWQIFDTEGNLYITGQSKLPRDTYNGENQNSLGLLLYQGDKKAFFSGDINNYKKKVNGELIGDEDRMKYQIGKIDFLKLGHHAVGGSNTEDYLNVLSPEYAVISNDIHAVYNPTIYLIENMEINYLYTVHDEYEICVIIYNDEVTLGFGTPGIKKVKEEIFYIPENKIYSHYLKNKIKIEYDYIEKSVNNWEQLKTTIEQFKYSDGIYIKDNCYIIEGLIITLDAENNNNVYNANSSILIDNLKNIKIVTNQNEIIIKRDKTLIESPLFQIEKGLLSLGEDNMKGKIIIDGNKENVASTSQLIRVNNGELSIYDNIIICNNLFQISYLPSAKTDYGSAIFADNYSRINMCGGEISNNIQEMLINKNMSSGILPETMTSNLNYDVKGAIFLSLSTLSMYGGKIINNQLINNSDLYSNENSTNNDNETAYAVYQRSIAAAIYADSASKVYLYKGEISNNTAENNTKINLIKPKEEKKTKLSGISHYIYGSAIYGYYCFFEIFDDFLIQNNSSKINSTININDNCLVSGSIINAIEGGQIHINISKIKINGGTIQNSNNVQSVTSNISPDEKGNIKSVSSYSVGGALVVYNCKNSEINNLKITKCKSDKGGAIYFSNSSVNISHSEFSYNTSVNGGALYSTNNCNLSLHNIKILNNSVKGGSGGGIFAYGELSIDGEKSSISNNEAEGYGGGILLKTKGIINNCIICNNKALKNSGGGIQLDGELSLNNAKIYKNWCNQRGGGINYENKNAKFFYDKDRIKKIVYDNKANQKGNDFYPEIVESM